MILGIEAVHRLGWIHRDVKPDNFLIASSGHLKISDFGLAFDGKPEHGRGYYERIRAESSHIFVAQDCDQNDGTGPASSDDLDDGFLFRPAKLSKPIARRRFARSSVGTLHYMSPEVLRGDEYDGRCDWWSLGIVIFEMFYGFTPWAGLSACETRTSILQNCLDIYLPKGLRIANSNGSAKVCDIASLDAQHFLISLMRPRLSQRLVSAPYEKFRRHGNYCRRPHVIANDADAVKSHPFFNGMPWATMHLLPAPWTPDPGTCLPAKYFPPEVELAAEEKPEVVTKDEVLLDPVKGQVAWDVRRRYGFVGWTYVAPQGTNGAGFPVTFS